MYGRRGPVTNGPARAHFRAERRPRFFNIFKFKIKMTRAYGGDSEASTECVTSSKNRKDTRNEARKRVEVDARSVRFSTFDTFTTTTVADTSEQRALLTRGIFTVETREKTHAKPNPIRPCWHHARETAKILRRFRTVTTSLPRSLCRRRPRPREPVAPPVGLVGRGFPDFTIRSLRTRELARRTTTVVQCLDKGC